MIRIQLIRICCLIIVMMAVPSFAGGLFDDLKLSGTFESQYWNHDPDGWTEGEDSIYKGPYTSWENGLGLNLDWRSFFAEIRLRSMQYTDPIHYDPRSREHETDFELFKYTGGYRGDWFKLTAGDFYKSYGRGIVLFVQENKELNLDRSIRGGSVDLTSRWIDLNVFGGQIGWHLFKDVLSNNMIINEYHIKDEALGARAVGHLPAGINLGASFVGIKQYEIIREDYVDEDLALTSADLQISGMFNGLMDFYAEYAQMKWDSEEPFGEEIDDGKAIYSSLTFYAGPVTILSEYKDYDYWSYRYTRPPTADRDDEIAETDDIRGPRIKVDYYFASIDTLFFVSAGRFDNHAHETSYGTVFRNRIDHIYGGIEQKWENLYAQITYGVKEYVTLDEDHRRFTSDIEYTIIGNHSVNLYYEYKFTGNPGVEKDEHKSYLTYSLSPYFSLTAHYSKHTIQQADSDETSDEWIAGEISGSPIPALTLMVVYGQLPPGLICSGGQCRIAPEFDGIQASLTYRF